MSVERGWGRDVRSTVQRRGDRSLSVPRPDDTLSSKARPDHNRDYFPEVKAKTAAPKIEKWMAGRQSDYPAMIKGRIEQKMKEMEGDPETSRRLAKRARNRVVWSILIFYLLVGAAPVILAAAPLGVFFLFGALIFFPPLRTKIFDWVLDTLATFIAGAKASKYK